LLAAVACVSPLSRDDREIDVLRQLLGLHEELNVAVSAAVAALCDTGVLRSVGRTYRFSPDLTGDVVLADRLSRADGATFQSRVVDQALAWMPDRVVTNLLHASQEPAVGDVIASTLDRWTAEERAEPTPSRQDRLSAACRLAYVDSARVLNLIETVLVFPVPPDRRSDAFSREELWTAAMQGEAIYHALSTDDVGAPLELAGRNPGTVGRALELVPQLFNLQDGIYDNYKPVSIVQQWHNPTVVSLETVTAGLATCHGWIGEGDFIRADLAIRCALTVLRVSWRYTRSSANRLHIGAMAGAATAPVLDLRRRAFAIIHEAIAHDDSAVRMNACRAVADIGDKGLADRSDSHPLEEQATAERCELYDVFSSQLATEQHLGVLHEISGTLLNSWLRQRDCCDAAEQVLREMAWLPELSAYRWATDPWKGIDDLGGLLDSAPDDGRWSWWIRSARNRHLNGIIGDAIDRHMALVENLESRHPGIDGFVGLLERLANDACTPGQIPPWLFAYHELHPEYFGALCGGGNAARIPEPFRGSVRLVWAWRTDGAYALSRSLLCGPLVENAPDALGWLLRVADVAPDRPTGSEFAQLLMALAGHDNVDLRREVVQRAAFAPGLTAQDRLDVLCVTLSAGYDTSIVDEVQSFIEHRLGAETVNKANLRRAISSMASSLPEDTDREFGELVAWSVDSLEQYLGLLDDILSAGISGWVTRPSRLWHGVPQLVDGPQRIGEIVDRVRLWRELELLSVVEADYFLRGVGELFTEETVQFICSLTDTEDEALSDAVQLLDDIPFEGSVDAWLHVVGIAYGQPAWPKIASAFASTAGFVANYSSVGGADPPQLLQRIELLQQLEDDHSGTPCGMLVRQARETARCRLAGFRDEQEAIENPR
jgi:hypothetical protein